MILTILQMMISSTSMRDSHVKSRSILRLVRNLHNRGPTSKPDTANSMLSIDYGCIENMGPQHISCSRGPYNTRDTKLQTPLHNPYRFPHTKVIGPLQYHKNLMQFNPSDPCRLNPREVRIVGPSRLGAYFNPQASKPQIPNRTRSPQKNTP